MTILTWAVAAVLTTYCAVVISAWAFQRSLIYLPDPARVLPVSAGLPAAEEIWFDRPDGIRLVAWYQPSRHGDQTLLYFHGNAGNLAARAERMRAYAELGYGMLMLSYRGYSGSTGAPSEAHNVMDAVAVFDWLRARVKDHCNIVLYGESLGSGVAVQLALQRRCGGLILDAPFTSIAELGQQAYPILPVKALLTDRYDTLA
ncbi:MAG TPA: alpha/beta fold hydrolase, partial [Hyphomicrobiaceae bacterium]|nr:alpha/beta fold hydrolase [Hyphomicrobiaceae bacterium]